MIKFLFKRIARSIPIIFGVISISFIFMYIAPGDPALSIVGQNYNESKLNEIRDDLNLNRPVMQQYVLYVLKTIQLDFGKSYITGRKISNDLRQKIGYTLILATTAMVFAIVFGVFFGIVAALNYKTIIDRIIVLLSVIGISTPVFSVALILIFIFGIKFQILPPTGYGGIEFLILPSIALGMRSLTLFIRITRDSFVEIINEDYMRTAKAKGLSYNIIIFKHGFKNLLIPIITIIGVDFSSYLTGAVLTESIFGWPGIGRYVVDSIMKRDFPAIQGSVLFMAFIFIMVNLIIDILYSLVNPQIREEIVDK